MNPTESINETIATAAERIVAASGADAGRIVTAIECASEARQLNAEELLEAADRCGGRILTKLQSLGDGVATTTADQRILADTARASRTSEAAAVALAVDQAASRIVDGVASASESAAAECDRQGRKTREELERGFCSVAGHLFNEAGAAARRARRAAIAHLVEVAILVAILAAIWMAKGQI